MPTVTIIEETEKAKPFAAPVRYRPPGRRSRGGVQAAAEPPDQPDEARREPRAMTTPVNARALEMRLAIKRLQQEHRLAPAPINIPLTMPTQHAMVLEGYASTVDLDLDRTKLRRYAFGYRCPTTARRSRFCGSTTPPRSPGRSRTSITTARATCWSAQRSTIRSRAGPVRSASPRGSTTTRCATPTARTSTRSSTAQSSRKSRSPTRRPIPRRWSWIATGSPRRSSTSS